MQNWCKKRALFTGVKGMEIITPSKWLKNLVSQSFLKAYPVKVIHNGIDTEKFCVLKNNCKEKHNLIDKKIILSVATVWNDLKGYTDFIKLAECLDEEYLIVLVGGREQVKKVIVPTNMRVIDRTQNIQELVELYNAADVYLNLTYCDTYPTVNLEAVACGTPVISYKVGGSTESTLDFGGIIVKRGDLKGVVEALKVSGELKVKIADVNKLDKSYAISEYMKLYQKVELA